MGQIRPMASAFQAWRPTERGAPACWRGSAHPGRPVARSAVVTAQCLLWRPGEAGGEEKRQGSDSGGATRCRLAVGPGPDSRAASQMTAARSLARVGPASSARGKEERGAWGDPRKETEWAEPG
jgi:hypothetical protein